MIRAGTLFAAVALGAVATSQPPLRVLRTSPADVASPTDVVLVTFDRPVAGQLEGTVDPRTIFSISPAVAGTVEWRDPITLRFTPATTFAPGTAYTVTIANSFRAMDGAQLPEPYRFSFNATGPRVLTGFPSREHANPQFLKPDAQFEIVVSTPVDLEELSRLARLELNASCLGGARSVALTATSQRPINPRDPYFYQYAGSGGYDYRRVRRNAVLRRVIRLVPERPLPLACAGSFVVPQTIDRVQSALHRWAFSTYEPLTVVDVRCTNEPLCPAGWAMLRFSTPVRGSEVLRAVRFDPATTFTVSDTAEESTYWTLQAALRPRTSYTITVDPSLTDVFGQRVIAGRTQVLRTTGYATGVEYPTGRMLVERGGFRTLAVRHVNVDTLEVELVGVPESLEAKVLAQPSWNMADLGELPGSAATTRRLRVESRPDVPLVTAVRMPTYNAAAGGAPTLTLVRMTARGGGEPVPGAANRRRDRVERGGTALVQVTDLAISVRLGADDALVWVTRLGAGTAAAGASVTLHDPKGAVRARGTTDAEGIVRFTGLSPDTSGRVDDDEGEGGGAGFEGYVAATLGNDRAVVGIDRHAWELSPWRFNVAEAWGNDRLPAAGAVFTERGIYRPGETVHAKAIIRTGNLGALRAPPRGDSLRWAWYDREGERVRDTVVALSPFGTAEQRFAVGGDLPLGTYRVGVALRRNGSWAELHSAYYRVAEYRPPEFLVSIAADSTPRFAGDTVRATVEARYLFGAPMGRAAVQWVARRTPLQPWALDIPGTDEWTLGEYGFWWDDDDTPQTETMTSGTDTLDAAGRLALRVPMGMPVKGRAGRVAIQATVTDVNRQTSSATVASTVHPASFYIGAKGVGDEWFWKAGEAQEIAVIAVRPDGRRVPGVAVRAALIRREWHRVRRERGNLDEQVGDWVTDTLQRCEITTAAEPQRCRFTPPSGGSYIVSLKARDEGGREASTSYYRWASGPGWVPWGDETQFKMDVIPDRQRYDVGDTATVLFASPFTDAEALITVEREGILEQRRVRITAGATSLKFVMTEAYVPNAFVSILVARGRSATPGGIADAGRPTIRVGYAELKVTPSTKQLQVQLQTAAEYRPGDTARVQIRVRDSRGVGRRSEVTLWAVDEGVLALTGYTTPDPVDLIYRPRGVGMRLASSLIAVAPQVSDSEGVSIKGDRAPGGGGGLEGGDILRSRFSSTAFFLGSVITDENGAATASAKLPDNLTTFRVMAVAVTAADRYGSGSTPLLVTRPLLARPALPRFLRRDDRAIAGVVVNQRAGGTPTVRVRATVSGVTLAESPLKTATLAAGRGTEVRYSFRDTTSDSVALRFDVTDGRDSDAVLTRLPVRPGWVPRAYAMSGVVRLTSSAELVLPADIDPERSRVVFDVGSSPLALIGGMRRQLEFYPYYCTEQITSVLMPLIALHRAGSAPGGQRYAPANARQKIEDGVAVITRRQRGDGGIGLWNAESWTTPWLSAHAGEALLNARAAGVAVNDSVIARLARYLYASLHEHPAILAPVALWLDQVPVRLAEQVAVVDFLSAAGRPDVAGENQLLNLVPQMAWEDKVRLAEVVARRGAAGTARRLIQPIWAGIRIEGRKAVIPDSAVRAFYFYSRQRPLARLLSATLAIDSSHALVGPLVETLVDRGREARRSWWNTQDYAAAVDALANFARRQQRAARRGFTVASGGQVVFRSTGDGVSATRPLTGLLSPIGRDSTRLLSLTVAANAGDDGDPLYFYVTVHEVPKQKPVRPDEQGIAVERWYESYVTGRPITSAPEGSLVRVRLRIRITADRQFLALSDPLPAGLEAVDLSLRTSGGLGGPGGPIIPGSEGEPGEEQTQGSYRWGWLYGSWDSGWWSPFEYREMRDDRVQWFATYLWPGTYTATYVARATTPGIFIRPPAHAEEMYNPSVQGRSDGGVFTVTRRAGR